MRTAWYSPLAVVLLVAALIVLGYSLVTLNPWGMTIAWFACVAAGTLLTIPVLLSRHTRDMRR